MSRSPSLSRKVWVLFAASLLLAGTGLVLPRLRPVPAAADQALAALRGKRDTLGGNDDATLARLRQQLRKHPAPAWTSGQLEARVGSGWRVEWQTSKGSCQMVRISPTRPRLEEWPEYLSAVKAWSACPGIVLESLDLAAQGAGTGRRFTEVTLGLRLTLEASSAVSADNSIRSDPSGSLAGPSNENSNPSKP